MTRVRVESFIISLDGYVAAPGQDIDNPGSGAALVGSSSAPLDERMQLTPPRAG